MKAADAKADQIGVIVKDFRLHRGTHSTYALRFFACELLNFINCIGQIFFIDTFLNGEFSTYGLRVLSILDLNQKTDQTQWLWYFQRLQNVHFTSMVHLAQFNCMMDFAFCHPTSLTKKYTFSFGCGSL